VDTDGFLKSDIHALITAPKHGHGGAVEPFRGYASALKPEALDDRAMVQESDDSRTAAAGSKFATAAGVVAEAVAIAQQAEAGQAAQAARMTRMRWLPPLQELHRRLRQLEKPEPWPPARLRKP
jgi:hypothetical protein